MAEEPTGQSVKGQEFKEPYDPGEIRIPGGSLIYQPAFDLTEAEWTHLKYGRTTTSMVAVGCLLVGLGSGVTLVGKLLSNLYSRLWNSTHATISIQNWEWWPPCIGILLAAVFYIVGLCLPNERKRVNKTIEDWFKDAKRHKRS